MSANSTTLMQAGLGGAASPLSSKSGSVVSRNSKLTSHSRTSSRADKSKSRCELVETVARRTVDCRPILLGNFCFVEIVGVQHFQSSIDTLLQ